MTVALHRSALADLPPATLYALLRLRVDVFVVEQACAYPELDGRDLEPGAELLWAEEDGAVLGTLRVLHDPDGALRIGRVATAAAARSRGVAAALMAAALERCADLDPGADVVLGAQAHLSGWYGRFGFVESGPRYDEDGIPHVPMRRAAPAPTAGAEAAGAAGAAGAAAVR
ncbi:GNAT family N-acetyltransferase [Cellulomonas endophytica]|uniref:GNAT family N-acetyltransferase n=1 Tax=Cellulomonas endophytica TaxID=2494735 RepID=UPI0010103DA9|nr:GNAT family N-acetyltransferase [Cellulomonas endophytica]